MRAYFRLALLVFSLVVLTISLLASSPALAQGRAVPRPVVVAHPVARPVVHTSVAVGVGFGCCGPWWGGWGGWYAPWGFSIGFGYPWGWGGWGAWGWRPWGPWYGPGWGPGPGWWGPWPGAPYAPSAVDDRASLRIEAKPRQAEVYVDGYREGIVDDFDGTFQRLHLEPGQHELVLYLQGYHTVTQHIDLQPFGSTKITTTMVKLGTDEQMDPPPAPPDPSQPNPTELRPPQKQAAPPSEQRPSEQRPSEQREDPRNPPYGVTAQPGGASQTFGTLSIRVLPTDAEIYIDGESWAMPNSQTRLAVQLADGKHKVEIRKEGFEKYSTEIQVHRAETTTLNVSLLKL